MEPHTQLVPLPSLLGFEVPDETAPDGDEPLAC